MEIIGVSFSEVQLVTLFYRLFLLIIGIISITGTVLVRQAILYSSHAAELAEVNSYKSNIRKAMRFATEHLYKHLKYSELIFDTYTWATTWLITILYLNLINDRTGCGVFHSVVVNLFLIGMFIRIIVKIYRINIAKKSMMTIRPLATGNVIV